MGFRLEQNDFKNLPPKLQQVMLQQYPELKIDLVELHFTGIRIVGDYEFDVVVRDQSFGTWTIFEFEKEINPKIMKLWKNYLKWCLNVNGKNTGFLEMPDEWQREIFEMLGIERIFDDEKEKYYKNCQFILED